MSQTFRIGPARLLTASSFDAPIPSWTDLGLSRGNAVVTLSHTDKSVGRADQQTPGLTDAVYQTPSPMEIRFMMTDRDVLKLVHAFPLSARLTSGAKTALGITTTPARITSRAFALVPQEDYSVEGSFLGSEFVAYFKDAYLSIDSIPVATPIEDTDDALSQTAFEIRIVRVLGSESGYGYPLATGQSFQGVLFAYQPSQDALSPLIGSAATFSRASTATYVDANGIIQTATTDTPRYQDGGLLLEPQRTNLVVRSHEFDNASWIKANASVTANAATSPDGAAGADLVTATSSSSPGCATAAFTVTASTAYTYTVYIKKSVGTWCQLRMSDNVTGQIIVTINPETGAITATNAGPYSAVSASSDDAGNGWFRYRVTGTQPAGQTNMVVGFYLQTSGDAIYTWGAQAEAGSYPTSYIPTSGSTVTRNADVLSAPRPSGLSVQSDFSAILNLVPLFGGDEETKGSVMWNLFGNSTRGFRYYVSNTPGKHTYELYGFTIDSSESNVIGTLNRNEDTELFITSDTDGDLSITVYEDEASAGTTTEPWPSIKNSTEEWGGSAIIAKDQNRGSWILKSFIVTSGLLTYDQIRSVLR